MDLLGTGSGAGQVIWYENSGDPANKPWKKHVIDEAPRPVHGHRVDMDGDGDVDVGMALGFPVDEESPRLHQIVWYENDGSPERGLWKKHVICESFANAFEAFAADLAGVGQMEEVTTAWGEDTGRIAVFKYHGDPRGPGRSKASPRIASPIHRTTARGRRSVPSFPGQRKARMVG